jgi:hypothetical protein
MLASVSRNQQNRRDPTKRPCNPVQGVQKHTRRPLGNPGLEKAHEREKHTS